MKPKASYLKILVNWQISRKTGKNTIERRHRVAVLGMKGGYDYKPWKIIKEHYIELYTQKSEILEEKEQFLEKCELPNSPNTK